MTAWVIDSSLALAWGLPDEMSNQAEGFLSERSSTDVFWVPALWWYEVSNALTMARRRRRLAEADRVRLLALYGSLPIQTDTALGSDAIWRFHVLAEEYGLSAYDAAYLDLAQRKGLGLATLDHRLHGAARKAGVRVIVI